MSDFETGIENKTPLIAQRGQESGRLIKENNFVVNLADWLSELATSGSGVSLNVTYNGSGTAPIHNFTKVTSENRIVHFEANFDSGLDALHTFTGKFDGTLMPETRNFSDSSVNGEVLFDPELSWLNMDVAANGPVQATIELESKNYIKLPQSGISYLEVQGVFLHNGDATTNTENVGLLDVSGPIPSIDIVDFNIDVFDGSGNANNPSGIKLNFDAPPATQPVQTFVLQFTGKNKGDVKAGFLIDNTLYFGHVFKYNNSLDYTLSYNLPFHDTLAVSNGSVNRLVGLYSVDEPRTGYAFRVLMDTTNDPALLVKQTLCSAVCYTVGADRAVKKIPFTAGNKNTYKKIDTANTPLFSVKCAATYDAFVNRTVFNIDKLIVNTAELNLQSACYISVYYNAVLVNDNFVQLPGNAESRLLVDISADSVSGGIELFSVKVSANKTYEYSSERLFENYRNEFSRNEFDFGNSVLEQVLTVVASPMAGGDNPTATIDVSADFTGGEVG